MLRDSEQSNAPPLPHLQSLARQTQLQQQKSVIQSTAWWIKGSFTISFICAILS